jgi:hypothetical protein
VPNVCIIYLWHKLHFFVFLPSDGETAVHGGAATLAPAAADAKRTAFGGGGFGGKSQHFKVQRGVVWVQRGVMTFTQKIFLYYFLHEFYFYVRVV